MLDGFNVSRSKGWQKDCHGKEVNFMWSLTTQDCCYALMAWTQPLTPINYNLSLHI